MDNTRLRSACFLLACTAILALSGCAGAFDPYQRPGTWSLTGASNETIAQQVANKADLISGQSEAGANGVVAVGGVEKATSGGTDSGLQTTITATAPGGSSSGS